MQPTMAAIGAWPAGGGLDLRQEIAIDGLAREQPGVPVHQPLQRLVRRLRTLPRGVESRRNRRRPRAPGLRPGAAKADTAPSQVPAIAGAHGSFLVSPSRRRTVIPRAAPLQAPPLAAVIAPRCGHSDALPIVTRPRLSGRSRDHGRLSHRLRAQPLRSGLVLGRGCSGAALGPPWDKVLDDSRRRSTAGSRAVGSTPASMP